MKKWLICFLLACATFFSACGGESLPGGGSSNTDSVSVSESTTDSESVVEQTSPHEDTDENEVCDICGESVIVTVDFYAMNDLHGKFVDGIGSIGVDELSTYLSQQKQANPNTVLLSSGDMWQGGSVSNVTEGKIVTEWMNEMGFSSMSMGNHEYDWSRSSIEANAELASFPFLAINLYDEATNERVDYCDASVMVEVGGVQIGIIGAIGNCKTSIAEDKRVGLDFKVGSQLTSLVKAEANALRAKGADYIVYSLHGDHGEYNEYDTALSNGYVDLVFEAHTHKTYCKQDAYGVYHVQGGGYGSALSQAQVKINCVTGKVKSTTANTVSNSVYSSLDDHPIVNELLEKYEEQVAEVEEVIGYNDTYRNKTALGRTVAQTYYEAGVAKWGTEYQGKKIIGGGGNFNIRSPGYIPVGKVKYGDLVELLPFDNALVLCSIRGSVLKARFYDQENADNPYFFFDNGFGKTNLQDNETYYIVTDAWNAPYGPNQLTEVAKYDTTTFARHLVADYVRNGGYGSKSDSGSGTVPDSGSGTTQNTFTSIPQILQIGNDLADNGETTTKYRVRGEIISIDPPSSNSTLYGNMTIRYGTDTLYVYGTYNADGSLPYYEMQNPPQVGDFVTLEGKICKYKKNESTEAKIELKYAHILSSVTLTTIPDALAIGDGLTAGQTTSETYYFHVQIKEITELRWGNMYVKDADGNEIYMFGLKDEKGNKYEAMSNKPVAGDTIVVRAQIQKYQSNASETIELVNSVLYVI